ncbi:hypothetical protein AtubIFM56815_001554 [Aspergillus tubingensis]|uniref:Uncharacterized protein n=2 Tax=Aspergillus subgen. Circumdati TaxID=2720871 RepID=A0A317VJY3_ASPEC|nr:uncharacterized protein BO83DRAFT_378291 [Aspergillus eucalypticola CBS 122712]PWY74235.1 hypothetical protein BO83DRAFT_378291 [Aspergillus eucalypticola CBS 122712]GLA67566.1 hypothetical protein AtubIFM54640_011234 [Aspergillus tubingensis]GLA80722.1 hypothetical protein AtubIFM56815_001554 [Aspergillus tubingensis]
MSLSSATGNLAGRPPKLTNDLKSTVQQTQDTTTQTATHLSDSVLPGEFPGDSDHIHDAQRDDTNNGPVLAPLQQWCRQSLPRLLDRFEAHLAGLLSWILPAPRQAWLYDEAARRPASTTFLICQAICCGVPLLVFLAGVFVFAAVAILLWAILSVLILGPVLLVASMMGVSLWGWGWLLYGLVKWIDEKYLGGLISRFWLSRMPSPEGQDQQSAEGQDGTQEKKAQ